MGLFRRPCQSDALLAFTGEGPFTQRLGQQVVGTKQRQVEERRVTQKERPRGQMILRHKRKQKDAE